MAIGVVGNDRTNKLLSTKENKYYDNSYKPNLADKNESHSLICQNVEAGSIVLDVGCSQGLIGKLLHDELECKVYGMELDIEAIKFAEETEAYERIFHLDITDKDSEEMKKFISKNIEFDYIIFSDVLEHLVNPAETLYFFGQFLKKNGKVLISLPNIANYDIIDGLLNEKFNYSEMGLLDNTHLRFFTIYSFAEYILDANKFYNYKFDMRGIASTIIDPPVSGKYPELENILKSNKRILALQNIILLNKVELEEDTPNLESIINEKRNNLTKKIENKLKEFQQLKKEVEKVSNELQTVKKMSDELQRVEKEKERLEKVEKELNNRLDFVSNEYDKIIDSKSWKLTKPLRSFNKIFKEINNDLKLRKQYKKDSKQSILFFIHSWINVHDLESTNIGGTTLHLHDLIKSIKDRKNVYIITVIYDKYMLVQVEGEHQKIYDLNLEVKVKNFDAYDFDFQYVVGYLIKILDIDLIHIHHFSNFPCDLHFLTEKIKTIITIHDYGLLCPRLFLLNSNVEYCSRINVDSCKTCSKGISFETRNTAVRLLLKNASKIIVPDESVQKEFNKYYNLENVVTINHGIDLDSFEEFKYSNKNINSKKVKNIAMIGVLDEKKGSKILKQLLLNNNNRYVFHFFGLSDDASLNKNGKNYIYHGVYEKKSLPKLLNENEIDLVLLLSICPESFSYALSEVMLAKIPVLSFKIGALGNRVDKNKIGETLELGVTNEEIFEAIEKMFKEKNYKYYINNLNNCKITTINEMVNETIKLYDEGYVPYRKDNYYSQKLLSEFYIKYRL